MDEEIIEELRKRMREHWSLGHEPRQILERILDLLAEHDSAIRALASEQAEHEAEHPFLNKHGAIKRAKPIMDEEDSAKAAVAEAVRKRDGEWRKRIQDLQEAIGFAGDVRASWLRDTFARLLGEPR